jgi:hypothetical protein
MDSRDLTDDLYRMAEAYGEEGRRAYIRVRFTFDLIWPLVYLLFSATTTSWVFGKAFPPDSLWQRASLVPLLGTLFDYLENLSTSLVMLPLPASNRDGGLAGASSAIGRALFETLCRRPVQVVTVDGYLGIVAVGPPVSDLEEA